LGGSRHGQIRRYANLFITMLLGGLWHGAGWTFIIWGGLHGLYLAVNHGWRGLKKRAGWSGGGTLATVGSRILTFLAVVVGWVFFRANSVASARTILRGMLGRNGTSLPDGLQAMVGARFAHTHGMEFHRLKLLAPLEVGYISIIIVVGLAIAWGMPNVRQFFADSRPTCDEMEGSELQTPPVGANRLFQFTKWEPSLLHGVVYGLLFFMLIAYMATAAKSEFLYFQF